MAMATGRPANHSVDSDLFPYFVAALLVVAEALQAKILPPVAAD